MAVALSVELSKQYKREMQLQNHLGIRNTLLVLEFRYFSHSSWSVSLIQLIM